MARPTLLWGFDTFNRVLACRETFLTKIVREALCLAQFDPTILEELEADIDRAAKESKKVRLMDEVWREAALPRFPSFTDMTEPSDFDAVDAKSFALGPGRPRAISPEVLLVLVVVDGVFSLTSGDGYERLVGSEVFQAVLGDCRTPARSTVGKYLDLVSPETHELLHRALYRLVCAEDLDSFLELTADSTAVEANTAWPTESGLIFGFLNRVHRLLDQQGTYTGVEYASKLVDRWLGELADLHRAISLLRPRPGSVRQRRKLYGKLLMVAEKTRRKLRELLGKRRDQITDCCIRPSHRLKVDAILQRVEEAFDEAGKAMSSARLRVLHAQDVAAPEKAFSLADPDAYMIKKGQRDPVVGYKPQLGRSREGFISCFEVLKGNPADSDRLVPLVQAHIQATGQRPVVVSTDDGYSSTPNLEALAEIGVEVVSFSGAKGYNVLGDEIYNVDACALLRSERSAVESTIFTFKHKLRMRRFCRRGLSGVQKDLSAAVLAFNLWRMAFVRSAKRLREEELLQRNVA